eukprot:gene7326-7538_t
MFLCAECGDVLTSRDELRRHLATAHQHGNVAESSEDEEIEEDIINEVGHTASPSTAIASAEAGPPSAGSNQQGSRSRRHRDRSHRQSAATSERAVTAHAAAEDVSNEVVANRQGRTDSRRGSRGPRAKDRVATAATGASAGTAAHGANDAEDFVVAGLHVSDALNAAKHAVAELWVPQRKPNPGANGAKVTLLRRPQAEDPAAQPANNGSPQIAEPIAETGGVDTEVGAVHDTGTTSAPAATSASRRRRRRTQPRKSAASAVEDIAAAKHEPDTVEAQPATEQGGHASGVADPAGNQQATAAAAHGAERPEHSRGRGGRSRNRPRNHGSKQGAGSNRASAASAANMDAVDVSVARGPAGGASPLDNAELAAVGEVAESQEGASGRRGSRSGRRARGRGKAAATSATAETGEEVAAAPVKVMWRPKSTATVVAAGAGSGGDSSATGGAANARGAAAASSSPPSLAADAGSGTRTAVVSSAPLSRRYGKRRPLSIAAGANGIAAAGTVDGITVITAGMAGMAVA